MSRASKAIAVLLAGALLAVSCGDSDDSAEEADTAAETTASAQQQSESEDQEDESTTTAAEPATGDSGSEWCDRIRTIQESEQPSPLDFNFLNRSPEQLEEQFTTNLAVFEEWADVAPPEIDEDIDNVLDAFRTLVEMGEEVDWNLLLLAEDPDFLEAFDDEALSESATNIDNYTSDVCGVDFDVNAGAPTPAEPESADGIIGEFLTFMGLPPGFLTDDQISCMNDELTAVYPDGLPDDFQMDDEAGEVFVTAGDACGL